MKKGKLVCKGILFILIFALLFGYIQELLRDKWVEGEYNTTVKVKGFYAEEKDSLDVVFVGSSQLYADIAPAVLFKEYGITSYDFCVNEQPLWISYYYIKEALKHQNPKVIVLDVFTVYGADYEAEGITHFSLDEMPMSINKIEAIRDSVPIGERYAYYFPLAKYHGTWTDFYQGKADAAFYDERDPYKGYSPFIFAKEYELSAKAEVVEQTETEPIPERANIWLNKIIDLCEEENVELVLIKTPNGNAERQKLYNSVAILAEERNVPFYNMNVLLDGQAHVNVIQAEQISRLMGEYLVTNYTFEDKRENPDYALWHDDAELFYRQKAKCELVCATDYATYLTCLQDENFVVCISSKNTGNHTFAEEDIALLNETFGLGVSAQQLQTEGYAVILDGGCVVSQGANAEGVVGNLNISISSPGNTPDSSATIMINGTDFSKDCDGINIAVYDKVLGEVFEMSAFDVTTEMTLLR